MTLEIGGMTRDELVTRMTSLELTAWQAFFQARADEADHRRDRAESGDGIVNVYGLDTDDDEDDDPETTDGQ